MASSETPSSQSSSQEVFLAQSIVQNNVRGKTNIAWAYCTKSLDGKSLICIYC